MSCGNKENKMRPILIGNVSGSTGDRLDGLKSMLSGSVQVDAITGDWLSEYNIGTRALQKDLNGAAGYEPGFLYSFRLALPLYKTYPRKLKFVVNAGGGNPRELALQVSKLLKDHNMHRNIAYITGDDVLDRIDTLDVQPLNATVDDFSTFRKSHGRLLSANVYIGSAGIQMALNQGADIVIVGRCTDASPVMALCSWWHGWNAAAQDELAGSLLIGHLIECGCYVTGGSFAGYKQMGDQQYDLSFPIAEVSRDGTAIIQKQSNYNGMISVDTVKTQFVYELQGSKYLNPDIIADFANVEFEHVGLDKVKVRGARGLPRPKTLKVAVTAEAGFQAEFFVVIVGRDAESKVESFKRQSLRIIDASKLKTLQFQLCGSSVEDPKSLLKATTLLRIFAQADDPKMLTRGRFLGPILSNQLQGFPALTPILDYRTADPKPFVKLYTGLVPATAISEMCHMISTTMDNDEQILSVPVPQHALPSASMNVIADVLESQSSSTGYHSLASFGPTSRVRLGDLLYGRSGDKGANVNVGLFFPTRDDSEDKWQWLRAWLSNAKLIELMGEDHHPGLQIERCEFPRLRAVHFVIYGLLGESGTGVSSTSSIDALGKGFVEFLRTRYIDAPRAFVETKSQL
ncbi:hypothetical protein FB567DRAFT_506115 [Paraphoma chrysanthemicola]|uniref:DUF1446-domain-containing protein n=1 Tax=Paraphoma chrysanthemicola TaxID=798071 RepID=A0A8K0VT03_9PLEO|nr:hypothetical protein FB567DRAFT_506115 [Paraphoma chrysanthemicola]